MPATKSGSRPLPPSVWPCFQGAGKQHTARHIGVWLQAGKVITLSWPIDHTRDPEDTLSLMSERCSVLARDERVEAKCPWGWGWGWGYVGPPRTLRGWRCRARRGRIGGGFDERAWGALWDIVSNANTRTGAPQANVRQDDIPPRTAAWPRSVA